MQEPLRQPHGGRADHPAAIQGAGMRSPRIAARGGREEVCAGARPLDAGGGSHSEGMARAGFDAVRDAAESPASAALDCKPCASAGAPAA